MKILLAMFFFFSIGIYFSSVFSNERDFRQERENDRNQKISIRVISQSRVLIRTTKGEMEELYRSTLDQLALWVQVLPTQKIR